MVFVWYRETSQSAERGINVAPKQHIWGWSPPVLSPLPSCFLLRSALSQHHPQPSALRAPVLARSGCWLPARSPAKAPRTKTTTCTCPLFPSCHCWVLAAYVPVLSRASTAGSQRYWGLVKIPNSGRELRRKNTTTVCEEWWLLSFTILYVSSRQLLDDSCRIWKLEFRVAIRHYFPSVSHCFYVHCYQKEITLCHFQFSLLASFGRTRCQAF